MGKDAIKPPKIGGLEHWIYHMIQKKIGRHLPRVWWFDSLLNIVASHDLKKLLGS